MSTLFCRRVGNTLHPDGDDCAAVLAKLPLGKALRVEIKQPRNGNFHRLYWALCARIGDAVGVDSENVSDLLKIETGHCVVVRSKVHGELRLPRSISYAAMDNNAFREFFERCVDVICTTWGIARPDVLACVQDVLVPTEQR